MTRVIIGWILYVLNAPTWVWVLFWLSVILSIISLGLSIYSRHLTNQNNKKILDIIKQIADLVGAEGDDGK